MSRGSLAINTTRRHFPSTLFLQRDTHTYIHTYTCTVLEVASGERYVAWCIIYSWPSVLIAFAPEKPSVFPSFLPSFLPSLSSALFLFSINAAGWWRWSKATGRTNVHVHIRTIARSMPDNQHRRNEGSTYSLTHSLTRSPGLSYPRFSFLPIFIHNVCSLAPPILAKAIRNRFINGLMLNAEDRHRKNNRTDFVVQ